MFIKVAPSLFLPPQRESYHLPIAELFRNSKSFTRPPSEYVNIAAARYSDGCSYGYKCGILKKEKLQNLNTFNR